MQTRKALFKKQSIYHLFTNKLNRFCEHSARTEVLLPSPGGGLSALTPEWFIAECLSGGITPGQRGADTPSGV